MILIRLTFLCLLMIWIACNDKLDESATRKETQSGAAQALDQWVNVRFDGQTKVSANALIDASSKLKSTFRAVDKADWRAIGPKILVEEPFALLFIPQIQT